MAQVTMTGKEYEELLNVKARYEELMFLLIGARFPQVVEEPAADRWSMQKTSNFRSEYPKWLKDNIGYAICNYVSTLSDDQLKNLVRYDSHYYVAHSGEFYGYETDDTTIDLFKDPAIVARWENLKIEMEAESNEQ